MVYANPLVHLQTKVVPLKTPATTPSSTDLFSKFSAAMKSKSAEVKGKLLDIIVNPSSNGAASAAAQSQPAQERHVSAKERNGKRYRNVAPVFSIDDDENQDGAYDGGERDAPQAAGGEQKEIVNLNQYFKTADIINAFKCQDVHMNGYMYDSHLIITPTQLVVLRELGRGQAQIMVRRPLASIVKITAKKRHRDLITFKYGFPDGDGLLITDMDRFLIPNATEATALVSKHIVEVLDSAK